MVVFGGGGKFKKRFNEIHIYDTIKNEWKKCECENNRPKARTYHSAEIFK